MIVGHLDPPYTLPDKALANIAFLYGGDRCQCDRCDRCQRRKDFASGFIAPAARPSMLGPSARPAARSPKLMA